MSSTDLESCPSSPHLSNNAPPETPPTTSRRRWCKYGVGVVALTLIAVGIVVAVDLTRASGSSFTLTSLHVSERKCSTSSPSSSRAGVVMTIQGSTNNPSQHWDLEAQSCEASLVLSFYEDAERVSLSIGTMVLNEPLRLDRGASDQTHTAVSDFDVNIDDDVYERLQRATAPSVHMDSLSCVVERRLWGVVSLGSARVSNTLSSSSSSSSSTSTLDALGGVRASLESSERRGDTDTHDIIVKVHSTHAATPVELTIDMAAFDFEVLDASTHEKLADVTFPEQTTTLSSSSSSLVHLVATVSETEQRALMVGMFTNMLLQRPGTPAQESGLNVLIRSNTAPSPASSACPRMFSRAAKTVIDSTVTRIKDLVAEYKPASFRVQTLPDSNGDMRVLAMSLGITLPYASLDFSGSIADSELAIAVQGSFPAISSPAESMIVRINATLDAQDVSTISFQFHIDDLGDVASHFADVADDNRYRDWYNKSPVFFVIMHATGGEFGGENDGLNEWALRLNMFADMGTTSDLSVDPTSQAFEWDTDYDDAIDNYGSMFVRGFRSQYLTLDRVYRNGREELNVFALEDLLSRTLSLPNGEWMSLGTDTLSTLGFSGDELLEFLPRVRWVVDRNFATAEARVDVHVPANFRAKLKSTSVDLYKLRSWVEDTLRPNDRFSLDWTQEEGMNGTVTDAGTFSLDFAELLDMDVDIRINATEMFTTDIVVMSEVCNRVLQQYSYEYNNNTYYYYDYVTYCPDYRMIGDLEGSMQGSSLLATARFGSDHGYSSLTLERVREGSVWVEITGLRVTPKINLNDILDELEKTYWPSGSLTDVDDGLALRPECDGDVATVSYVRLARQNVREHSFEQPQLPGTLTLFGMELDLLSVFRTGDPLISIASANGTEPAQHMHIMQPGRSHMFFSGDEHRAEFGQSFDTIDIKIDLATSAYTPGSVSSLSCQQLQDIFNSDSGDSETYTFDVVTQGIQQLLRLPMVTRQDDTTADVLTSPQYLYALPGKEVVIRPFNATAQWSQARGVADVVQISVHPLPRITSVDTRVLRSVSDSDTNATVVVHGEHFTNDTQCELFAREYKYSALWQTWYYGDKAPLSTLGQYAGWLYGRGVSLTVRTTFVSSTQLNCSVGVVSDLGEFRVVTTTPELRVRTRELWSIKPVYMHFIAFDALQENSTLACDLDCGNGACQWTTESFDLFASRDSFCVCDGGWAPHPGQDHRCTLPVCPTGPNGKICSGRGSCASPGLCECDSPQVFSGDDCSVVAEDSTPPTGGAVTVMIENGNSFHAVLTPFTDSDGLVQYAYLSVGTTAGASDVMAAFTIDTDASQHVFSVPGVSLNTEYFVNFWAVNYGGTASQTVTSSAVASVALVPIEPGIDQTLALPPATLPGGSGQVQTQVAVPADALPPNSQLAFEVPTAFDGPNTADPCDGVTLPYGYDCSPVTFKLELNTQSSGVVFAKPLIVKIDLSDAPSTTSSGFPTLLLYTDADGWTPAAETCSDPYEVLHLSTSTLEVHICHFTQFAVFKRKSALPPGPHIVSFIASDPSDENDFYDDDDRISVGFSEPTNKPVVATKTDIDTLFEFSSPIGADYSGSWNSAGSVLVIDISAAAATAPNLGEATATLRVEGGLRDADETSAVSTATSPALSGNWGTRAPGPSISSFVASDPDNTDAEFSAGDIVSITFSEATNEPAVATKTQLDALLSFSAALAGDYTGEWTSPTVLVVTITSVDGVSAPEFGTFTVSVRESGNLRNADETSAISTATSPSLSGNWGTFVPPGPSISSFIASDPDNTDAEFSAGDIISITFSEATNEPTVATKTQLDALLSFSAALAGDYTGEWTSPTVLVITITSVGGVSAPEFGTFTVSVRESGNLLDAAEASTPSTATSPPLSGNWGTFVPPGPTISALVASDPDSSDAEFSTGDTVSITFSEATNEPTVATKTQLDALLSFSAALAGDYTGEWTSPTVLEITITSVGGVSAPEFGTFTVSVRESGNLRNAAESSVASTATSPALSGNWGSPPAAPIISSFVASDPDNTDAEFSIGDTVSITFDQATNEPAVASKTQLDALLSFSAALAGDYTGEWTSPTVLVITITSIGGVPAPEFGTFTVSVRESGDLRNAAESSVASTATSPALSGNWGTSVLPGPTISSFVASDPDNGDAEFSAGDTVSITFSEATNEPAVATKTHLDALLSFSATLGSSYIGEWTSSSVLVITITSVDGVSAPEFGTFTVSVRESGDLRNAAESSAASTTTSPALSGNWGTYVPPPGPTITGFAASDPDNADDVFSDGDELVITFSEATNAPAVATETQLDALLSFSHSIGVGYTGIWRSLDTELVIVVTDAGSAAPEIGTLTVSVRAAGGLRNAAETSAPSTATSSPLTGNFGIPGTPPTIVELIANDPDDGDTVFSAGDTITVVFSEPTNMPALNADLLFTFSSPIGAQYVAAWSDSKTVVITINDAGAASPQVGILRVSVRSSAGVRDAAETTNPSSATSPPLSGDWGQFVAPPELTALVANDPDNLDGVYSVGDTVTLVFDKATNAPDVSSQARIDALLSFSEPIGSKYSARWRILDRELELEILELAGTAPLIGSTTVTVLSSSVALTDADGQSAGSTSTSPALSGDWGEVGAAPEIVSFEARDPDGADNVYSEGDVLVLGFNMPTNQPEVSDKFLVDDLLSFSRPIGFDYSGVWASATSLVITIIAPVSSDPGIGTLTVSVRASGGLTDSRGSTAPSTSTSNVLTGSWGSLDDRTQNGNGSSSSDSTMFIAAGVGGACLALAIVFCCTKMRQRRASKKFQSQRSLHRSGISGGVELHRSSSQQPDPGTAPATVGEPGYRTSAGEDRV